MLNDKAKKEIKDSVEAYEDVFYTEFNQFKLGLREKKEQLKDQEFGKAKGLDFIDRVLYEIPETLHDIIIRRLEFLNDDSIKEFKEKDSARWFARTFPQYRLVKKV